MYKRAINFMKNHPQYNATIHGFGGVAVGMFIIYYFKPSNPVLWIVILGGLSILGHLYALFSGKK